MKKKMLTIIARKKTNAFPNITLIVSNSWHFYFFNSVIKKKISMFKTHKIRVFHLEKDEISKVYQDDITKTEFSFNF